MLETILKIIETLLANEVVQTSIGLIAWGIFAYLVFSGLAKIARGYRETHGTTVSVKFPYEKQLLETLKEINELLSVEPQPKGED